MLYFAYGSNMYTQRLQSRVPSATKVAAVSLPGYELCFHKTGDDGSGKCTIKELDGSVFHGVIFEIESAEKENLDRIEGPGYKVVHLKLILRPKTIPCRYSPTWPEKIISTPQSGPTLGTSRWSLPALKNITCRRNMSMRFDRQSQSVIRMRHGRAKN